MPDTITEEQKRLKENYANNKNWLKWGPYLSERQWATIREDYSADGDAWNYITHDNSRSKAYRWGEDGIAGISDNLQRICFGIALWNGRDEILKERLFIHWLQPVRFELICNKITGFFHPIICITPAPEVRRCKRIHNFAGKLNILGGGFKKTNCNQ